MLNVSEALEKAIKENMPSMVGEELKKVLTKAESDAKELTELKVAYKNLELENSINLKRILELESLGYKHEDLVRREDNLAESQRLLKVSFAEKDAANSALLAKQAFDMVGLVFRNAEVRKSVLDSNSSYVTIPGHAGNNWQTINENKNTTKNYVETKETK